MTDDTSDDSSSLRRGVQVDFMHRTCLYRLRNPTVHQRYALPLGSGVPSFSHLP
jgi:hypothetical protein